MKSTSILSSGIYAARPKKINKHIEIVGSTNPRLNALARKSRETIAVALRKVYANVGITVVNDMDDLKALVAKKPDLVVLGMKLVLLDSTKSYDESPKMWLATYLEDKGIAYTGSGASALELEYDKDAAKQKVIDAGLRSAAFSTSTIPNPKFKNDLRYPMFVKPTNRGNSKGIDEQSVVYSDVELKAKIQSIHSEYESDVLIEEYLPGREFSVAVIKQTDSNELLAMPIEIIAPVNIKGQSFLSAAVKHDDSEEVSYIDDSDLKKSLNTLAVGVFKAIGSRDFGRIDMRLDAQGQPNFIEANLMPGLSNHGYLSRCFYLNEQISYEDMILAIVALGLKRESIPSDLDMLDNDSKEILSVGRAGTVPTI